MSCGEKEETAPQRSLPFQARHDCELCVLFVEDENFLFAGKADFPHLPIFAQ